MADAESDDEFIPHSSPLETKVGASTSEVVPREGDTYHSRRNRYFEPDSTWLTWNEQERLAARSLDEARSQDLTLHLLNAHALKRKAENEISRSKRSRKGKRRASSVASGNEGDGASFQPPRRWTAWPLPPEEVPRDVDEAVVTGLAEPWPVSDTFPSASLEQCLIGVSTKFARERWSSREWASPEPRDRPKLPVTAEPKFTIVKIEDEIATQTSEPRSAQEPELSEPAETLSSESDSDSDSEGGRKVVYSQAYIAEDEEPNIKFRATNMVDDSKSEEHEEPPTPIADDEQARAMLLPSTRQTLSKLDDLLMGLHKARRAYASSRRRTRRDSEASDGDADHMLISRSRSRSRARRTRRSSSRTSDASSRSEYSTVSEASRQNLGLRDWSDVVGMAALTGWDPAVVQRASERCAKLFEENMIFRTFHQGNTDAREKPSQTEHYALELEDLGSEDDTEIEGVHGLRTTMACEPCKMNRRRCEPAITGASNGPCKRCLENGDECTGIGTGPSSQPARCPFRFCERHHIPFGNRWHLQRHIEAVHSEDRPPMSSSPARSSASEGYLASTTLPVCPVPSCPRHEEPFSEGGKLYRHLRNMHPEVDVDAVKRLEVKRRGERRGRWRNEGRRREVSKKNRSRSLGVPSSPPPVTSLHALDDEG